MNVFQKWWENFSRWRKTKTLESGYEWAMAELLSDRMSLEEVESYVEASRHFDLHNEFDEGVEQACHDWNAIMAMFASGKEDK